MENGTADSNLTNRVGTLSLLAGRLGGGGNLNGQGDQCGLWGQCDLLLIARERIGFRLDFTYHT